MSMFEIIDMPQFKHKLIVKIHSAEDHARLSKLIFSKKNEQNQRYKRLRPYSRSEWIGRRMGIIKAFVVGCLTEEDAFKLSLMFNTEPYGGV